MSSIDTPPPISQRSARTSDSSRARSGWPCAVAAALILYGSWYPLVWAPATATAWARLWFDWKLWSGPGDTLGNIALFVPWGAACLPLARERLRGKLVPAAVLAVCTGFALAMAAQIGQVWVPSRSPSMGDVVWNMVGCILGLPLGTYLAVSPLAAASSRTRGLTAAILAACVVLEWLPLLPSIDLALVKSQVKVALDLSHWNVTQATDAFATMLIAGWALSSWWAGARLAWLCLLVGAGLVIGKLFIVHALLTASVWLGLILGGTAFLLVRTIAGRAAAGTLALVLVVGYSLGALAPFRFRDAAAGMNWVPFAGFLKGAMLDNSRALLGECLVFVAVLQMARESGSPLRPATFLLAAWCLILEGLQCLIETRSGDVSTSILVVLTGLALSSTHDAGPRATSRPSLPPDAADPAGQVTRPRPHHGGLSTVWMALIASALIVFTLRSLLRLPQLPYNVTELFRDRAGVPALVVFSFALLWLGAGPAWLGRRLAACSAPAVWLPAGALGVSLVSLLLVWSSASDESVGDIAGSSNLYWFVVNKDIWGETMRHVFLALGPREPIDFIERCVRYSALYGPLPLVLGTLVAIEHRHRHGRLNARWLTGLLVGGSLAMWLCKGIAFDWASTDNLNELIARDGPWGWGGGGWLYALLGLLVGTAWLLGSGLGRGMVPTMLGVSALVAALPLGWWLLNSGLNPAVEKYGQVFSGAQFLLGPDRSHHLSSETLFWRWCALQTVTVCIAALGIWLERRRRIERDALPAADLRGVVRQPRRAETLV